MLEVEQKFQVHGMREVRARLITLGASPGGIEIHADTYFRHPSRDFAATDEAFRLRRKGAAAYLTYKGPKLDATTKTRHELEVPLSEDPAIISQFEALISALGFSEVAQVHKRRELWHLAWQGRTFEIGLDQVKGLGDFVELENQANLEQLPEAKSALEKLSTALGLTHSTRESYLGLLLQSPPA